MKATLTNWDFKTANTKEYTHCFHNYPAMMIPQIARNLIYKYGKKAKLLFDPYCGTGTSLVEANLQGINAIGTDLNPLARLITQAKTTPINIQTLDLYLKDLNNVLFSYRFGITDINSIVTPDVSFKNINYWFTPKVQKEISILKKYINHIENSAIKNFFNVAFSETVRDCSLTKKGEFKLVRIPKSKISVFDPDTFGIMLSKLARNKDGLKKFMKSKDNTSTSDIYEFNTICAIPSELVSPNSVDIVVTSPPYGDSRTTVAYGQFSRFANQWLGNFNASSVDTELMGGKRKNGNYIFINKVITSTIDAIRKKDEKRCLDVISFFQDYDMSIRNIASVIKKGGHACYVVGNRTVKGQQIPMDEITKLFFYENGLKHIETIIRNIPNKRMPLKNSPSNIKGQKASTIKKEYLVICQKQG